MGDAPAPDVTQGFDHDGAGTHQVGAAPVVGPHVQIAQQFQGVMDGLHPRSQFFLQRAGQKAQFAAHRDGGARHDQPAEFAGPGRCV